MALQAGMAKSAQGRYAEAEVDVRRALLSQLKSVGKYHFNTANILNNFSYLLMEQGRVQEADALARVSMEILDAIGYRHDTNAYVSALLRRSAALFLQERYDEAKQSYAAVDAATISWSSDRRVGYRAPWARIFAHYYTGEVENGIALARQAYERSKIVKGEQHYDTAFARATVAAGLAFAGHDAEAMQDYTASIPALLSATNETDDEDATVRLRADQRLQAVLEAYIALLARSNSPNRAEEGLRVVDAMRSRSVRNALSAFAARAAARTPALADLARKEQDLHKQVLAQATLLDNVLAEPPEERQESAVKYLRQDLERLRKDRQEARQEIQRRFPEYAALINPKPTSAAEVQSLLAPNEALVLFVDTDESSFIWVVTKVGIRWVKSELGTKAVTESVAALRCGLDAMAWLSDGHAQCQKLLRTSFAQDDIKGKKPLPFDLERAYELYKGLFGQAEDLLKNADGTWKELLVVPSRPLTGLPLQVLLTEDPKANNDLAAAKWLGLRQPVTILPSISSLKSLRRDAKKSIGARPYIGFGNPTLDGIIEGSNANTTQQMRDWAKSWQSCADPNLKRECQSDPQQTTRGLALYSQNIREFSPLPQTACELCTIGQELPGTDTERDIRLGASATESEIKRLGKIAVGSERSALQDYRVIHFATHGMVADVSKGYTEPGLILTPPPDGQASDEDNGYLTASEIAGLKLDADWVILSACNTAAGMAESSEALSGLARAFFYAGARTLLVSNWEVYTDAAVDLTTRTLKAWANSKLGRAAAVQLALKGMLTDAVNDNDTFRLHPSYWGAFSIVGEGGK
jgi:CHAT domain-containing protein